MEIDNILEEDLMAALEGMDTSDMSSVQTPSSNPEPVVESISEVEPEIEMPTSQSACTTTSTTVDASSMDITSLLKELLNNKSLEITIRLKDN